MKRTRQDKNKNLCFIEDDVGSLRERHKYRTYWSQKIDWFNA